MKNVDLKNIAIIAGVAIVAIVAYDQMVIKPRYSESGVTPA